MQCHNGFTFPSAGLLLVAAAGLFLSRRPRFAETRPPRARGRVWPWLAAAGVVLAICWTAPIADQIAGQGNMGHVLEAGKTKRSRQGSGVGVKSVVLTVGVRPWWLKTVVSPWSRKYEVHPAAERRTGDQRRADPRDGSCSLSALALWRRRLDVATGAAAALAMSLAIGAVASATPTGRILGGTLAYTLWSASIIGMFAWLMAAYSAVVLGREALGARVRSRRPRGRAARALAKGETRPAACTRRRRAPEGGGQRSRRGAGYAWCQEAGRRPAESPHERPGTPPSPARHGHRARPRARRRGRRLGLRLERRAAR